MKKVILKISQNSQENSYVIVSFLIKLQSEAYNFTKNETLVQTFSCEFCEIFKNTYFIKHLRVTASALYHNIISCLRYKLNSRLVIQCTFCKFTLRCYLFFYFVR